MKPEFFYDVAQNSPEWAELRRGILTASNFGKLMAAGKERERLIRIAAGERVSEQVAETYQNEYMRRGKQQEPEALAKYALVRGVEVTPCGFIRLGRTGCSPDSLVGKDGGVQIKTIRADLLIEMMFRPEFPTEHIWQCSGEMWIAGRKWWDLCGYSPGMPLYVRRLTSDRDRSRRLQAAIDVANAEIDTLVRRIKGYRPL